MNCASLVKLLDQIGIRLDPVVEELERENLQRPLVTAGHVDGDHIAALADLPADLEQPGEVGGDLDAKVLEHLLVVHDAVNGREVEESAVDLAVEVGRVLEETIKDVADEVHIGEILEVLLRIQLDQPVPNAMEVEDVGPLTGGPFC